MVYITQFNLNMILNNFKFTEEYKFLNEELDFNFKKDILFSRYEEKEILIKKHIICNFEDFLKINNISRKTFVERFFKNKYFLHHSSPAYHFELECEKFHKDFENYILDKNIPEEIIDDYKNWVEAHKKLMENKNGRYGEFLILHKGEWGEGIEPPEPVNKANSGLGTIDPSEVKEIERKISQCRNQLASIYREIKEEDKKFFCRSLKKTYQSLKNDSEIKNSFIRKYKNELEKVHKIKKMLIDLMTNYYLATEGSKYLGDPVFLEKLGFKKCSSCGQTHRFPVK